MNKRTPGPWFTRKMFSGNWDIAAEDGNGKTLARTEKESDARLIAAAPETLSELKTVVICLQMALDYGLFTEESTDEIDSRDEVSQILDAARAAIAKAEGWTP